MKTANTAENGTIKLGDAQVPFTIVRSQRRKRTIAFALESPASLRITAPSRTSYASILKALETHAPCLTRKRRALQKTQLSTLPRLFLDGETIGYLGHAYRLRILRDATKTQGCTIKPRRFTVIIADETLSEHALRQEVRLEIKLWLKKRAKTVLQKRLAIWSKKLGIPYKQLSVTSPERRWGSCSARNAIRLNWRLIMAPLALIDYVVVHELCHVAQKNHGPTFWRLVAGAMPDYQKRRKHLRLSGQGFVV